MKIYKYDLKLTPSVLLENLRTTTLGQDLYHHWPYAVCSTPSWNRLVILPFYREHLYPVEYYHDATLTEC